MKIYEYDVGHLTKMAVKPIYSRFSLPTSSLCFPAFGILPLWILPSSSMPHPEWPCP